MRLKFEIASDDTLTVVDSEFEAETGEVLPAFSSMSLGSVEAVESESHRPGSSRTGATALGSAPEARGGCFMLDTTLRSGPSICGGVHARSCTRTLGIEGSMPCFWLMCWS